MRVEAADLTRQGKDPSEVDYHDYAARWDAQYGGDLARIARDVGLPGTGDAPRDPRNPWPRGPKDDATQIDCAAQVRAMKAAVARVAEKRSHWSRADLIGGTERGHARRRIAAGAGGGGPAH
jgi:hypothetical protein